ncbi:hypothetical protein AAE478_005739 [Parahypoxylon ruwenzoriense]
MPTTRRSAAHGHSHGHGHGKQSTLSFNHRVTKSGVSKSKVTKDLSSSSSSPSSSSLSAAAKPPAKQSSLKHVSSAQSEPTTEDEVLKEEEDEDEEAEEEEQEEEKPAVVADKSEAELRAEKISDRQISRYWDKLERERVTKRVHQEDLSLAEKVLRYWDVSSQYGPCVGITRMKRWKRADRLGLHPPLEVLAVLIKEEAKGTKHIERAHLDEILNSTAVGAVE